MRQLNVRLARIEPCVNGHADIIARAAEEVLFRCALFVIAGRREVAAGAETRAEAHPIAESYAINVQRVTLIVVGREVLAGERVSVIGKRGLYEYPRVVSVAVARARPRRECPSSEFS